MRASALVPVAELYGTGAKTPHGFGLTALKEQSDVARISQPVQRFPSALFFSSVGAEKVAGQGLGRPEGVRSAPFRRDFLIAWRNGLQTCRSEGPPEGISCKAQPDIEG